MSLKLDDLETFKKHRNEISESLISKFVGREKDIDDICNLLFKKNFVAITGPAGIGKSRTAVAAIEKYSYENKDVKVLCVKSFGDYISAIDESIEDSREYLFLVDDANNFKRLGEVIECLKYHQCNVKAILTVRDYLKDCIDDESVAFYEMGSLSGEAIKKAIKENTPIKNGEWLDKIADISKGNIRLAFVVADAALKDEKGFASLFNVKDVMNAFYKGQIAKMGDSNNLMIVAGIISFFKSVYLNQLFYISPILKIVGISKQEFLHCVDVLISMELADECVGVVKISDQCFGDYLLDYVFIEKKYLKIRDLITNTYKYYKRKIIESLNTILSAHLAEDSVSYLKKEVIDSCDLIEDLDLKHDIEVVFAPLAFSHASMEFKKGVEDYTDKKDIEWLLGLFRVLAKSKYQSVANEGVMRLLKKTNLKKESVFKAINETYYLDYDDVKSSFKHLNSFVDYLFDYDIRDERFLLLVSFYLKYSFRDSKFVSGKRLEFCAFNVSDDMNGIIAFRRKCWDYIFSYGVDKSLDAIMDFARYYIADDAWEIVKSDLEAINEQLNGFEGEELIQAALYEELIDDAKKYGFESELFLSVKYSALLKVLLERKTQGQNFETFREMHEENVHNFYVANRASIFETLKDVGPISRYYKQDITNFLSTVLKYLDEFSPFILSVFIQYMVYPRSVVEKASSIIGLGVLYEEIKSIGDGAMKEEYLDAFYSLVNEHGGKDVFGFDIWLERGLETAPIFGRSALSLRRIAENSNIPYVKLVKIIFKKRGQNEAISKEYLSYLFFEDGAFKELIGLDKNLAIAIYEFLISRKENDYGNKALKEIINVKRNYIKTFVERYLKDATADEEGLEEIVFDGDNYKLFFDACIEIGKKKLPYFIPLNLQRFVSWHLRNQKMLDWVFGYIDKNRNDDAAMESLFSILAGIDRGYRNTFVARYYKKGKDENVLRCALLRKCKSYSLDFAETYFKAEIKSLESLKMSLIKWDNLNLTSFIDKTIEKYKEDIMDVKVSQLIEYVDSDLLNELQEIDVKTEVSLVDAFKLYSEDENFRRLLSSGYVSYKDGCFVTKSDTPLKFADVIKNRKIIGIRVVQAIDDGDAKYEQYLSSMKGIVKRFQEWDKSTLDEYLYSLFLEMDWTVNKFTQETALTKDLFSKIKNKKRESFEKKTLIQMLIGMRLPKEQRDYLLEKNGTQLSIYNVEDALYEFMLASEMDIDTADALLKDLGRAGFIKEYQG